MDFSALENLSGSFGDSRVLHTAVELDLFAAIGDGATADQVAASRGLDPRATELLLNAMTALELLKKADGTFTLSDTARRYLLPDGPDYFGHMIALEAGSWALWGKLADAVKSGRPQRPTDMYQSDPAETHTFIMAMDSLVKARGDDVWLANNLDLTGVNRLLDVGSGPGTYPIALCGAKPALAATIFDLPGTLAVTEQVVAKAGMTERITLTPGDYNADPLPGGFDMVLLSNVIHLENEADNARLMARCFDVLNPGGRIVIKDHVLEADRVHPEGGALFALFMLLAQRGRVYTREEIGGWLTDAGFEAPSQTDLPPPFSSSLVIAYRTG
ncbi:MAG: methyltransferase [Leptospirillia bacterium]